MSCDCNTLVIGEAGAPGPQGLGGFDGTNGTNGVNAFTTLTASFTQPAIGANVTISVANSAWIALGQNIYIAQAGYYTVMAIVSSTSSTLELVNPDLVSPGAIVSSNRRISPSSVTGYIDPNLTSIDINQSFTSINPAFRVSGSNSLPLIQADAVLNRVGINVSPAAGGSTLTVGGSMEVTGNALVGFVSSGYLKGARLRVGSGVPAAELTKLLFFAPTATVTLAGTVGAVQRVSVTCTGAALGDVVTIGYGQNPTITFEDNVSITAVVSATNTVNVFFHNYSTTPYTGATVNLNVVVSTYTLAV
jgi:hypothetical protein